MSLSNWFMLVGTAKRVENPRDPFVMPLLATVFWSVIGFVVMVTLFPFKHGEGMVHLILTIFMIGSNWAFWKAYFVAKQNRED